MSIRRLAIVAAALAVAFVAPTPAPAQDKTFNLKGSIWLPPAHPLISAFGKWAKDVEKESGGTLKTTIFPSEQLGKAFDHYDMTRDGIVDFAYINPGYQPGRFPVIAAPELPFLINNSVQGTAAVDAWYRKYAPAEMKDIKVCLTFLLAPGTLHSTKKKVVVPEDIKGMKIRPANATLGEFVTLLGGTNVQASAPEARETLERGVSDAITFPWGSTVLFGIDKVTKYHIDMPFWTGVFVWGMNKAKYDEMSPAQKTVIDHHCTNEWAERIGAEWSDMEATGKPKIASEPGQVIYKITPDQLAAWRKAAAPLKAKWAAGVKGAGLDPDAVYDGLIAELKARHSLAE